MIVRAVLPCPADRFSSNTLFGEPGISPQGSPMTPARCRSRSMHTVPASRSRSKLASAGIVPVRRGV